MQASHSENATTTLTPKQRRRNQIKLLILWLVPFGLMAIAGVVYYLVQTGQMSIGSNNNGDLIRPPVQLQQLFEQSGHDDLANVWDDKWTMVIRTSGTCEEGCKQALYLSRQLHIRLDKQANRVQRILLIDNFQEDPELMPFLKQEHALLKVFVSDDAELAVLDAAVANTVLNTSTAVESGENPIVQFFLVDPQSWAMMVYHQGHEGNAVLKDLKHLLRYSKER